MPEQVLLRIKQRIRPEWKIVVVTTFLFGLIAHMYKFTNHLPNWDSLMEYYYPTPETSYTVMQTNGISTPVPREYDLTVDTNGSAGRGTATYVPLNNP